MNWSKLRFPTYSRPLHIWGNAPGKRATHLRQVVLPHTVATMPRPKGQRKPATQNKPPLTHFLCLPLVTDASKPQLERSIRSFRDDLSLDDSAKIDTGSAEPANAEGINNEALGQIHPKAIRPVGVLHCTLGVMSLNQEKLDEAIKVLETLDNEQLMREAHAAIGDSTASEIKNTSTNEAGVKHHSTQPLKVDLRGLFSMHAPQNTSILYTAPEDQTDRLYPFCLALQKIFKEKELLVPDDRKLKLHATLVNTIYAKGKKKPPAKSDESLESADGQSLRSEQQNDRSQGHGPNAKAPLKIDARGLLEKYKDFMWAENVTLDRVAICEMGAKKKVDADGNIIGEEYTQVASVNLPS